MSPPRPRSSPDRPGRRRELYSGIAHIPNFLTVVRILLAALFPFVSRGAQIAVLSAAMATEFLDGVLARRFGWQSRFGRIVDPIADKLVFVSVAGTFLLEGRIAAWQLAAAGARDLLVVAGAAAAVLLGRTRGMLEMKPGLFGKATTALQYAVLFVVLFGYRVSPVLIGLTCLTGLAAAEKYRADFLRD